AAIERDQHAGHERGGFGRQEQHQLDNVPDLAPASQRVHAVDRLAVLDAIVTAARHGGLYVGGTDRVHADAGGPVLQRQHAGEAGLGALGDVVGGLPIVTTEPGGGDHVDDAAAVTLRQELPDGGLRGQPA